MFTVEMLPAEYGDCLWVEYGEKKNPRRMLIDAGTSSSYPALKAKIERLPAARREFELLVVTHIDVDHIGGVLPLLDDLEELGATFKDVWFNGYSHIEKAAADDTLGALQGEQLSARLVHLGLPWNRAFGGEPIVVPSEGELPSVDVAGMKITLLSPRREELVRLRPEWDKTIEDAGLGMEPGVEIRRDPDEIDDLLGGEIDVPALLENKFASDAAKPNGSSIAFVAEYGEKAVLFGADAFPGVLAESLGRMKEAARKRIKALKLPHHGSRNNLSVALLKLLPCKTFLVSSNGDKFHHPNRETVARIVSSRKGAHLKFNYRNDYNECWDDEALTTEYGYDAEYGEEAGLVARI